MAGQREARGVTIIENQAKLTTMEAAAWLGVSRQFLMNLLENDEIPFHRVGIHRRIDAADLMAYQGRRDRKRSELMRDLAAAENAEGSMAGSRPMAINRFLVTADSLRDPRAE